jgi:ectoine hydroxylase-related dioxygenase (phytanoyl-CoA dioxygenase family)
MSALALKDMTICNDAIPEIEITNEYKNDNSSHHPTDDQITQFREDGYSIFPRVFSQATVDALNHRLELVLRGEYDTGFRPDKTPKRIKTKMPIVSIDKFSCENGQTMHGKNSDETRTKKLALGYSGNKRKKVLQVINIHKSDRLFRELVTCPLLGMLVAKLMNWEEGARLCQDQIWAKPPGAPPLAFHRDSPYFMFDPSPVATVWIALDNMEDELGPLTYVRGSHKWGDGRVGSSQNFFQDDGGTALLFSAAEKEGVDIESLEFESMNKLLAGGLSIHGKIIFLYVTTFVFVAILLKKDCFLIADGRTWHGSSANMSDMPRRGIGLHFVPVNVKWRTDAMKSSLWRKYVEGVIESGGEVNEIELNHETFPVTWTPNSVDL